MWNMQPQSGFVGSVHTKYWQAILTRYQRNQSSQDTNTLGTTEGMGCCKEAAASSARQSTETRYNFRLLERDKRAYRNQLQLLTNQTHPGFTP